MISPQIRVYVDAERHGIGGAESPELASVGTLPRMAQWQLMAARYHPSRIHALNHVLREGGDKLGGTRT